MSDPGSPCYRSRDQAASVAGLVRRRLLRAAPCLSGQRGAALDDRQAVAQRLPDLAQLPQTCRSPPIVPGGDRDGHSRQVHSDHAPAGRVKISSLGSQPAAEVERTARWWEPAVGERLEQLRRRLGTDATSGLSRRRSGHSHRKSLPPLRCERNGRQNVRAKRVLHSGGFVIRHASPMPLPDGVARQGQGPGGQHRDRSE